MWSSVRFPETVFWATLYNFQSIGCSPFSLRKKARKFSLCLSNKGFPAVLTYYQLFSLLMFRFSIQKTPQR